MDNKKITVLHSNGEKSSFKPRLIGQSIIDETGIDEELALKIQKRIANKFYKLKEDGLDEITTGQIRAEVSSQLLKEREFEAEEKSRKLGMSVGEFEALLENGCKDNANIGYSPEMIAKYAYDSIAKEYALIKMPQECANAHKEGLMHCLSGNNDLIVKVDNKIKVINIVEIVDSYNDIDYFVPSVDPKTKKISWKKIIDGACTGVKPVYEIEFAKGYKIECTGDHKFLKFNSRDNCFNKDYDICIDDFKNYSYIRLGSLNKLPVEQKNDTYYESAFYGFFLGDGSVYNSKITFHLKKEDKINYIIDLLKKLEQEYKIYKFNDAVNIVCDNFIDVKDKYSLVDYSLNYKGLLEGLINSDGYVTTHGSKKTNYLEYDSTNKFISDLFFISCLTLNIRPSYRKIKTNTGGYIYRLIAQNNYVNQLLKNINLRKGHAERLTNNLSKNNVYELTSITPKKVTLLGEQLVYNITVDGNHNYMAGTQGFVLTQNCHDLEYYYTRPNCFNMDLRFLAKNGLKVDGKGNMGSVAKPAKSLEVLLNHMLQAWMAGATVFSGGQGYVNFNTLLAPFCRGRTYKEIKQAIQGFIFNCNMSLICRGGQVLFSSIALDLSCPVLLANQPAIGPGGISIGVYKDYQEEADLIFKAVCEVSDEKDGQGAFHRFPNILFNIREGDLDEYSGTCKMLHETGANNPTIYYNNCIDLERSTMGALTIDTPVMTDKGFRYPNELRVGDNVMTYNEKDGGKSWNRIYNIIEKEAPRQVYEITCDNGYSFKVTSNHKLPTSEGIVLSDDLKVGMELYDYIDEPFTDITDDYEKEFVGIFLADGFIRHTPKHDKNSNVIDFHFRNSWKKDYVENLCKQVGYDYDTIVRKDGTYTIYVRELELRNQLVKLYDDNLNVKKFPNYWDDKNSIANVLKGLMFDARQQGKHSWVWSCSDKELVYDVCYAISYLGMKHTIYKDIRKGKTGNWRPNYRITYGKQFRPRHNTKIKSIELVSNSEPVYDLSITNNPNYVCGLGGIHSENCRSSLPMNYTCDFEKDCLNTGNFMYNTINLPLIALEARGDLDEFYKKLNEICEICYTSLIHRRKVIEDVVYNKHMSDFLLQKDKDTGEPLWDIDRTTITIGYCGLHECLEVLYGKGGVITYEDEGVEIIDFLNKKKEEFFMRDGLRWSVISSPSESTAFRFGEINRSKYPNCPVQGKPGAYYLTNSHHIPVNSGVNWIKHIENAGKFAQKSLGGAILHIWSGEVWSDPEAIWKLNKKILEYGNPIFWAYSKVFTYCTECAFTINDKLDVCPICGSKNLRLFDRITGYYLCVDTFNPAKQQEFKDRKRHMLTEKKTE